MSDLTYSILDTAFATLDLSNASEEEISNIETKITSMLRENGVTNASAVAHDYLTRKLQEEAAALVASKIASGEFSGDLAKIADECGLTTNAFAQMIVSN